MLRGGGVSESRYASLHRLPCGSTAFVRGSFHTCNVHTIKITTQISQEYPRRFPTEEAAFPICQSNHGRITWGEYLQFPCQINTVKCLACPLNLISARVCAKDKAMVNITTALPPVKSFSAFAELIAFDCLGLYFKFVNPLIHLSIRILRSWFFMK